MNVKEIMREAIERGACEKSGTASDWKSLAWLLFSPQGREFVKDTGWPDITILRDIKDRIREFGIYIDAGSITCEDISNVCIAGDTEATLYFDSPKELRHVIVMHGASAVIVVRNYAVITLLNVGGDVHINHDKTTRIIFE